MTDQRTQFAALLEPARFWTQPEILSKPYPVPRVGGVYAWFFSGLEDLVPGGLSVSGTDRRLLYVGIAPRTHPNAASPSYS